MRENGFTSRTVGINGLTFHYADWGGNGSPLVMLHGLSGHARTWDHTAAALSDRYHVLALDQRGHGDTDWAPKYGFAPMAQDLLGFLDALDLREVTLMGLSMGGIVSFVFAAAHPERVEQRWEAWRAVSCPVLLVRGDDSDVLATETAQRMLAENPNATMASVPDCGHSITLDNPNGMLEVVSPWLAAAEAGQATSA